MQVLGGQAIESTINAEDLLSGHGPFKQAVLPPWAAANPAGNLRSGEDPAIGLLDRNFGKTLHNSIKLANYASYLQIIPSRRTPCNPESAESFVGVTSGRD